MDALIGAAVALTFSQLLFPPNPLRLVRRAEAAALWQLSDGLAMTARASAPHVGDIGADALDLLWQVREHLAELGQARRASRRVVEHSLAWRRRRSSVVQVAGEAAHLDALASTCQTVARTVLAAEADDQRRLAPALEDLSRVLKMLAEDPASPAVRDRVAEHTSHVSDELRSLTPRALVPARAAPIVGLQLLIDDVLILVGAQDRRVLGARWSSELPVGQAAYSRLHDKA